MLLTHRQLFLDHVAQTSDFSLALEITRAEGIYLYDPSGKRYFDLISGIGVSGLGHRHPRVIKAIQDQLERYTHLMVYGEFVQAPQVLLAKALSETLPPRLSVSYFVNSGSEAVEGAIKLAKRFTGRPEIVSFINSYHGSTHGPLSLNGNENIKRPFRPLLPGISHINFGDITDLDKINKRTAAVVIEVVQGEAGIRTGSKEYFAALKERCIEMGALLICDEIQTGFGRTGKFWSFEHYPFEPDILLCAKGMGGGMPLGAFISSPEIMSVLRSEPVLGHITTFGGHPVCAAASLETLKTIMEERLCESVEDKARLFLKYLKHPRIKEIRHKGLMMAVEFESFDVLKPIIDKALTMGIITDWFLNCDNAMRIAPPLIISNEEISEACQILLEAIKTGA
jgi:putrescine aminotransferase